MPSKEALKVLDRDPFVDESLIPHGQLLLSLIIVTFQSSSQKYQVSNTTYLI